MKKLVKVVLIENIDQMGIKGDSQKVARGYAKNYLLPKKMAVLANDPQAKKIIKKLREERAKIVAEIKTLKKLAEKISQETITIAAKVGVKGKLFGSIGADDIAKKFDLNKKNIQMEPIKSLGKHQVKINLGQGIVTFAKVEVEPTEKRKKTKTKK